MKELRLTNEWLADAVYANQPGLIGFDRVRSVIERYGLVASPLGEPETFTADFAGTSFAGINISKFRVSACRSVASSETLSRPQATERYNFSMFDPSLILLEQEGRSAELLSGGVTFIDTRKTRVSHFPQLFSGSLLSIPIDLWHAAAPAPDPDSPFVLPTESVTTRLAHHLAMHIVDHGEGLPEGYRETVARQVIELISIAVSGGSKGLPGTIYQRIKRMQVRSFISNNLSNTELGPRYISQELGISLRSLFLLFQDEEMSITEYIWDLRLARSKEILSYAEQGLVSVKAICYLVGFKSPSHFATAFRKKYGCSPSEYSGMQK